MGDFEDAKRRANSPEFEGRIAEQEDLAARYDQTVLGSTKEVMNFYRRSGSPPLSPAERRLALKFEYLPNGADAEHTLLRTSNPEAALELLCEKYVITYTRTEIDSGNVVIVDKGYRWRALIKMAAEELGVEHEVRFGEAKFL